MEDKLCKLDESLKIKIINTGLKHFSIHGYDKASYNEILKEAGISKGRFYQYIKSKQALFDYINKYIINVILSDLIENDILQETDILIRLEMAAKEKLLVYSRYPYFFDFNSKFRSQQVELFNEKYGFLSFADKIRNENVNKKLFAHQKDIDKQFNIIRGALNTLISDERDMARLNNIEIDVKKVTRDIDEYLELCRVIFYNKNY